jgi:hypothetical protein
MRNLNSSEKGALILGGALIVGGAYAALFPAEKNFMHSGMSSHGVHGPPWLEHVSKNKERETGVCSILMGAGIVWLALYQGKD